MTAPGLVNSASAAPYCHEIDSLRALAMMAVVAMHAKLLPFGWTGVWLFFVISGYVVTLSILRDAGDKRPIDGIRSFFQRRIGRIIPLYYVYILAGLVVGLTIGARISGPAYLSLFGFYHNVAMAGGYGEVDYWPVGHLWTIAVEMQFYLVYGLVAYCLPLCSVRKVLWFFVIGAPIGRLVASLVLARSDPEAAAYTIYSAPGLHFDSFAMGALLAIAQTRTSIHRLAWPLMALGGLALAAYVGSYAAINMQALDRQGLDVARDIVSGILFGQFREVFLYSALGLFFLGIVALTAARSALVQFVTGLSVLQWIGRISYGGYIVHPLCLQGAHWLLTGELKGIDAEPVGVRSLIFLLAMGLTLAVAWTSFRVLEKPTARWVQQIRRNKYEAVPV